MDALIILLVFCGCCLLGVGAKICAKKIFKKDKKSAADCGFITYYVAAIMSVAILTNVLK